MADWLTHAPQAARDYLDGRAPEEIECIVSDLPGIARGKAMPGPKFARQSRFFLPRTIFHQTITGGWASVPVPESATEPDMILTPDYGTATAAPWTADRTLQVIHDMELQQGGPVPAAPRNVLKRVIAAYAELGLTPVVAPEMEFYLVARNTDPGQAIVPMIGRTGRQAAARQAYSLSAVDEYGPVIDDIYDFAEAQGFEIDGITQEGGAGQLEINLRHGNPIKLADEVFFFKRLIREAALRHGCFATFMAKPIEREPGSSMHIHHSVLDADGRNIFSNDDDSESDAFRHFIGGLQEHLPSALALLAPYVNSYRRYVKDFAAPVNLEWGRDNRTAGLRIPVADAQARRVENRIAGMDCNPYLGIAASLACGLLGLRNKLEPRAERTGTAYGEEQGVPRGLFDALELFDGATELHDVLSPEFAQVYSFVKREEYDEYLQVISPWEREHLLINV
ncbi:Gamma-glutamylputrescine synthetase PuuA [Rhodobacteraceae bacterium THAF1]|uniref:glutamine synthetase family protein n=1 Tax=Palleronia sp. THAF1 TaxID=2587842 RepID=UPI000F401D92|nr:glutamine synthetase family protein [Palleronia sp. THAF1]QFU09393.1 Gamma-glutamylputrescine synthetase PuuA [Palleronia sp. THAF1]VDC21999.1 Gamma-glutamylputrescine synthetase PuuA [Rhodobacteraceae bacterium THAF1]